MNGIQKKNVENLERLRYTHFEFIYFVSHFFKKASQSSFILAPKRFLLTLAM